MNSHLTSEEIFDWIIGERTQESERHIAECALCRGEVDRLDYAFRQFRDSALRWSEHWYTAPAVRRPKAVWSWRRVAAIGGLVSAALVIVLLAQPSAAPLAEEEAFLQIPYVAPLAPYEQTRVMRMEVSMTALKAAGFEVHAPELSGALTVDVLVGQDGRAHAIRPIHRSTQQ
jgi:hypothetical protein